MAAESCRFTPLAAADLHLPKRIAWLAQSRATTVAEQAVSTVKHGPRKDRVCDTRPESPL